MLRLYPGITQTTVDAVFQTPNARAVIMETWGSGNASTQQWFIDSVKKAIKSGLIIVNITQCDGGAVELGRYETSKYLQEAGVISGYDLTFEAAVTKLMFLLGQNLSKSDIKRLMQTSLRGEMTTD